MHIAKSIKIGLVLLIGLNLLMAMGAIWAFMRMAPAIEIIIERNEESLQACEEMLASLALLNNKNSKQTFMIALKRTENNITEPEEPAAIKAIQKSAIEVFQGNIDAKEETVNAILELTEINRQAMIDADLNAKKLGYAGAWCIVFMAIIIFYAGRLFYRTIRKNALIPLEEIYNVIQTQQQSGNLRRCTGIDPPQEVLFIFNGINEIIDKYQFKTK